MMLLGLTKAQLDVYRAKAFTIGTLTPLDRLLNLGTLQVDDLVLEVKCADHPDYPTGYDANVREFWYSDIRSDVIGSPVCPSPYGVEGCGPSEDCLELATPDTPNTCPDQLATFPTDNNYDGNTYPQEGGSLICDAHADVEFKLYKQGVPEFQSVSETYDLRTY
jgi:hypothetical protein